MKIKAQRCPFLQAKLRFILEMPLALATSFKIKRHTKNADPTDIKGTKIFANIWDSKTKSDSKNNFKGANFIMVVFVVILMP